MTELKRAIRPVNEGDLRSNASKRQKVGPSMSRKERKEKLSEQIAAVQHLVSPYGKTDAASVLAEAMDYIKFLHEQVKVLSAPYLYTIPAADLKKLGQYRLRSKGLCLVPISYTSGLAHNSGADIWAPIKSPSFGF